ncbi:Coagulation factor IX (Fragment) [Seminavis robusta]|uniref:Coagulation factor IX n=1 Tax=Seminavis robusta TaxID=568900 RepID=A0A9N8H1K9_9STRA
MMISIFSLVASLISFLLSAISVGDVIAVDNEKLRRQASDQRNLIVDGARAEPGEFPWFVSLLKDSETDQPACGGTLIAPNRVLTAGHCVVPDPLVTELGPPAFVRLKHTTHSDGVTVPVDCVSLHPDYSPRYNDLAIVKLAENAPSTQFVELNSDTSFPWGKDESLTTVGFGSTSTLVGIIGTLLNGGRVPKSRRLKKVVTRALTEAECQHEWNECADYRYHLCDEPDNDGHSCYGDSGGPVLDDYHVQVGIVSFITRGFRCNSGAPHVATNVAQYYNWILNEIRDSTCSDDNTLGYSKDFVDPCLLPINSTGRSP